MGPASATLLGFALHAIEKACMVYTKPAERIESVHHKTTCSGLSDKSIEIA